MTESFKKCGVKRNDFLVIKCFVMFKKQTKKCSLIYQNKLVCQKNCCFAKRADQIKEHNV